MLRERLYTGLIWATMLLGISGCAGTIVTPLDTDHATTVADPDARNAFAYPREPVTPLSLSDVEPVSSRYSRERLLFHVPAAQGREPLSLTAEYYRGHGDAPRRLVIIVPVWGNGLYRWPSTMFSRYVRGVGEGRVDILEIDGTVQPLIDWDALASAATEEEFVERSERMVADIMQTVVGIRRMVDWAESRDDIDHDSVALVGFSMGSIVASMALGSDPRFNAGAVVMGAADLSTVFASCQGRVGGVRKTITERFDWSTERYRQLFARLFRVGEPMRLRGFYRPSEILMIDSMYDDCMPRETRDALWEALGHPRRLTFVANHRMAFLSMTPLGFNYGHRAIYDFIDRRLQQNETRLVDSRESTRQ